MYTCANCPAVACCSREHQPMPGNCPMRQEETMNQALEAYQPYRDAFVASSEVEAMGYGRWPRLLEVVQFCGRMGYTRLGMAFCKGLQREAAVIARVFEDHGLEVVSVICKTGGISKELAGIPEEHKLHPGEFEPMCNPIAQAMFLNREKTHYNVAVGLCVGHDSLFFKHSQALVTTLIAKDRVLAHNPVGAVYCADGYFKKKLAPAGE